MVAVLVTHTANTFQNIISVVCTPLTWWGKKKIRGVYTTTAHWNLKISTNATTATLHSTSENSMLDKFQNWVEHWQKPIPCDKH